MVVFFQNLPDECATDGVLVQVVRRLLFVTAFVWPLFMFIRKYSYKAGVLRCRFWFSMLLEHSILPGQGVKNVISGEY